MKGLLLGILGAIVTWIIISFFTDDWNSTGLIYLIIGILVGYQIGKQGKENLNWVSFNIPRKYSIIYECFSTLLNIRKLESKMTLSQFLIDAVSVKDVLETSF